MDQKVKVRLDRGETRSVQIGRGVRHGWCLPPILLNLHSECLTKGLETSKYGGHVIGTLKYADDFVLLAKEEKVILGKIYSLVESGRWYGVETVVKKKETTVHLNSRDYDRSETTGEFQLFGWHNE
jgi:hypothetical protein